MSDTFIKRLFFTAVVFLLTAVSFGYGLAIGRLQIWPYDLMDSLYDVATGLAKYGEVVPRGRRFPAPAGAARQAFTVHDPNRISDGYYAFIGWDDRIKLYAAWLYDSQGNLVHTWPIDYYALDPDGPLNGSVSPHPFHVLPDGSILVGFDHGDVLARLDPCGEVIWKKKGIYHHSLSRAEDGSFWVWRGEGTPYGHYNYMENFDAGTGAKIGEIGLIQDVVSNMGSSSAVFGVRPDYPFESFERDPAKKDKDATDLFHPNDVDILSSDLAPMFPMFEAGDLLLSFRNLNLVAVLDPESYRLKWWSHGPWIGQHDPDFTVDGMISVFSNNTLRERSEIIQMDPGTKEFSNDLFGGEVSFKTDFMGKHQYLPNGNVLIIVSDEGRALEVTAEGTNVAEFNNISSFSLDYNEHLDNGMWVSSDYFDSVPQCSQ
jgi:hypothetical protein